MLSSIISQFCKLWWGFTNRCSNSITFDIVGISSISPLHRWDLNIDTLSASLHYDDVIMGGIASQITSLTIVYSNRLFRRRSKKTSKLRVTGLCAGNSLGTGEFPAQMTSYVENVSIWWRHHAICRCPSTKYRAEFTNDNFAQYFWSDDALNSFSHCEVYMWNASALAQAMACCLFGTKRVPKPKETYCQLDHQEHTSMKLPSKNENLHWR